MGIRTWLNKLSRQRDDEAIEESETRATATDEEEYQLSPDISGLGADAQAARLAGEASIDDVERLGD